MGRARCLEVYPPPFEKNPVPLEVKPWLPWVSGANLPVSLPHLAKSLLVLEGPGANFRPHPAPVTELLFSGGRAEWQG